MVKIQLEIQVPDFDVGIVVRYIIGKLIYFRGRDVNKGLF